MSTAPTSETEAVNIILGWNGDAPVSSLSDPDNLSLTKARATLTETSRRIQKAGWSFNHEWDYPLSPNAQQEVPLPLNALEVDPSGPSAHENYVERGRRLYDKKNHTFKINKTVYVNITFFLPFTDLPEHARDYFTLQAALTHLSRDLADPEVFQMLRAEVLAAQAAFVRAEMSSEDNSMRNNRDMQSIINPQAYQPGASTTLKI